MDIGAAKAAAFRGFDNLADDVIDQCLLAATAEIERMLWPRKIVAPSGNYTEDYDGDLAVGPGGTLLYLDQYPLISVTSVTEDGVALAVGTGYDPSGAIAVLREDERGILRRRPGGTSLSLSRGVGARRWAQGRQNIRVVYRAGYIDAAAEAPDLAAACIELAVLIYKQQPRSGMASAARQAGSASYTEGLSERAQKAIDRHRSWYRPRMRAAA